MKTFLILLTLVFFTGCGITEDERDFYYTGWFNPNAPARWKSSLSSGGRSASRPITEASPQMERR